MKQLKQALRETVWRLLDEKDVSRFPFPTKGRIPNFEGSDEAALKVMELEEWKNAKVVFSNPDYAQKRIREYALRQGKTLIMASPKLKSGYIVIDSERVKGKEEEASTIRGAFKYGYKATADEIPKPDLVITGCVAVGKDGYRLGKGGGYGDREIQDVTRKFGRVKVITTIHDLQLTDKVPVEKNDAKVDIIVTPTRLIRLS